MVGWVRLFDPALNRFVPPNPGVFQSCQINPNFSLDFHKTRVTYNEKAVDVFVGWVRLFDPALNRFAPPNPVVSQSCQINPNFLLDFHKTSSYLK